MKKQLNIFFIFLSLYVISINYLKAGNYFDVYGAHPRSNGMANAVSSFINDVSSTLYNPAGLGMPSRFESYFSFFEKNDNSDDKKNEFKDQLPETFTEKLKYLLRSFTTPLKQYSKIRSQTPIHELTFSGNYAKPVNHVKFDLYDPASPDLKKIYDSYISLGLSLNLNSFFEFDRIVRFGLYVGLPASGNLALINDLNPTTHRFLQNGISNERPIIHTGIGIEI